MKIAITGARGTVGQEVVKVTLSSHACQRLTNC